MELMQNLEEVVGEFRKKLERLDKLIIVLCIGMIVTIGVAFAAILVFFLLIANL